MKNLTIIRPNAQEIAENSLALDKFIMAMMGFDLPTIQSLLLPNRRYFKKYNNFQTILVFRNKFNQIGNGFITGNYQIGTSLLNLAGATVVEFTWAKVPEDNFELDDQEELLNGPMAVKMTLVMVFSKGKITDIQWARKVASVEMVKKMGEEN